MCVYALMRPDVDGSDVVTTKMRTTRHTFTVNWNTLISRPNVMCVLRCLFVNFRYMAGFINAVSGFVTEIRGFTAL